MDLQSAIGHIDVEIKGVQMLGCAEALGWCADKEGLDFSMGVAHLDQGMNNLTLLIVEEIETDRIEAVTKNTWQGDQACASV